MGAEECNLPLQDKVLLMQRLSFFFLKKKSSFWLPLSSAPLQGQRLLMMLTEGDEKKAKMLRKLT